MVPKQDLERKNLASLVDDFDRRDSDIAIVAQRGLREIKTSYRELASLARRFAQELIQRKIAKGERVLLWGENNAEWVGTFFGCVLRGVLPVPLDSAGSQEFARRVASEVSPRLIVASRDKLQALDFNTPNLSFEDLLEVLPFEQAHAIADLSAEDALQIIFTSGTTGEPKGIVHTHGNVLASLAPIEREMQRYLKYERPFHPIRFLHTLPLSHVFGQFMGLWIPPLLGAEVHYQNRLVASELAEQIRREKISVVAAVPRVLDLMQAYVLGTFPQLAKQVEAAQKLKAWQRWWRFRTIHRLLGWKFWAFICGGASLSASGEEFWNALGFLVVQGYGMTETTALVSLNHPFHPAQGTIGQVLPGREVKLSDEGEILVRGQTISNTIWQQGGLHRGESEWLPTGDLAEFDSQGNLHFRGRKKDVIVSSAGLNIHPEDLESALAHQPEVRVCAVVETDTGNGPEPLAVIVSNHSADPAIAVAHANEELAEFQQIRRWLKWPEPDLPRTSTGKVLRREIARRVANGEVAARRSDGVEAHDLDLDSLGRVQLQAKLEQQYGITLDDSAFQKVKTEEDVQQIIGRTTTALGSEKQSSDAHRYWRWPWNPIQQAIRSAFLTAIAMPVVRFLGSPAVESEVTEWPASPMLIVANHITSYDAAFILFALPRRVRNRVAIAMSGEMLLDYRRGRNQGSWFLNVLAPFAYFLITALFNVFPLPQQSGFRRSFRHAGEALDRGYNVLVFPEGRRSDDGTPQRFKSGAGLLWKELGTSTLPVHLSGLGELKTRGGSWFRSGKILITVHEILRLEADQSPEELAEELQNSVFVSMKKVL
ncbi:MAG: AMP-binding protein [Acidobacteriota bacterium]|nr:AMP-binding protein [Acidobacteriota bacterium]